MSVTVSVLVSVAKSANKSPHDSAVINNDQLKLSFKNPKINQTPDLSTDFDKFLNLKPQTGAVYFRSSTVTIRHRLVIGQPEN